VADTGAIRAGSAFVELFSDSSKLDKGLKDASRKLQSWGSSLVAVGSAVFAAGLAIDAAFDATALAFTHAGIEAGKMAARTGVGVEEITALGYAAERTGGSVEGLETALFRMERTVTGAMDGSREAADALRALGLSAGQLVRLTPDQQFKAFAEAISRIPNTAEQAARAQKVFGRGVLDILPLLKQGASGIEEFERRARELHLPISADEVKTAREFHGLMVDLKGSLQRVAYEVGKVALPALERLRGTVLPFVTQTIEWIGANQGLVLSLTKAGLALAGVGAGIVAVGIALKGLGVAVQVAQKIGFLFSPGGLLLGGLVALAAYAVYSSETLRATFTDAWDGIVDAVKAGDLALAGKIAFKGLQLAWEEVKGQLTDSFGELKFEFIDAMSRMILSSDVMTKALIAMGGAVDTILNKVGLLSDAELAEHARNNALLAGLDDKGRKELQDFLRRKAADKMAAGRGETAAEIARLQAELAKLHTEATSKAGRTPPGAPGFTPAPPGAFQGAIRADTAGTFAAFAAERLGGGENDARATALNTALTAQRLARLITIAEAGGQFT
jgi:hypothetical protein